MLLGQLFQPSTIHRLNLPNRECYDVGHKSSEQLWISIVEFMGTEPARPKFRRGWVFSSFRLIDRYHQTRIRAAGSAVCSTSSKLICLKVGYFLGIISFQLLSFDSGLYRLNLSNAVSAALRCCSAAYRPFSLQRQRTNR